MISEPAEFEITFVGEAVLTGQTMYSELQVSERLLAVIPVGIATAMLSIERGPATIVVVLPVAVSCLGASIVRDERNDDLVC